MLIYMDAATQIKQAPNHRIEGDSPGKKTLRQFSPPKLATFLGLPSRYSCKMHSIWIQYKLDQSIATWTSISLACLCGCGYHLSIEFDLIGNDGSNLEHFWFLSMLFCACCWMFPGYHSCGQYQWNGEMKKEKVVEKWKFLLPFLLDFYWKT